MDRAIDDELMLDLVSNGCTCGGLGGTGHHLPGCMWHGHDQDRIVIDDPGESQTDVA
jgi:hypothetical protein